MTRPTIVALVDDDVYVLTGLRRLLMSYGLEVYMFSTAEQFLETADTSDASCVVLDLNLQGEMSGVELGRMITQSARSIPIIFMTGSADRATRKQALGLGCVALLEKPFPDETLIAAILKAHMSRK